MVSDGGKGSARRKEDVKKIHDNWDRIFGNKKDAPMNEDNNEDYTDDDFEDDGYEICHRCKGSGEGTYDGSTCGFCNGTGEEPVEKDCDDDYT
jgi:RecJ-like exonuclease